MVGSGIDCPLHVLGLVVKIELGDVLEPELRLIAIQKREESVGALGNGRCLGMDNECRLVELGSYRDRII